MSTKATTVASLIAELSKLPPDTAVVVAEQDFFYRVNVSSEFSIVPVAEGSGLWREARADETGIPAVLLEG